MCIQDFKESRWCVMNFSERFSYLLDCEEISQKEMASILNLTPPTISNYVTGAREPDFATLVRIADHFGVSTDYLLGHEPDTRAVEGETAILKLWRQLSPAQREFLLRQGEMLKSYALHRTSNDCQT